MLENDTQERNTIRLILFIIGISIAGISYGFGVVGILLVAASLMILKDN